MGGYGSPYGGFGGPGQFAPGMGPPGQGSMSQYVQTWLTAVQSVVVAICTFSQLVDSSFRSVVMSVGAVSDMSHSMSSLRQYVRSDGSYPIPSPLGRSLVFRRNPAGLPWYIFLLLVYALYRLARRLTIRLLGWESVPAGKP
eukprot:NODE_6527_length_504_cov_76.885714_g5746_i0.p3 GENE.NODE_6527_length_504_cov_76.885714_g5746_i0~~NODE_6527_length_504_cov_76.885714_g5746_i0.p3  ORF type:complete len:153 (-),score=27.98 NODE_6527_length_504_cov_76.885714_g5746_i0:46-471(-)